MLDQALDFRDESDALFALLDTLDDSDWVRETQFKHWTPNDILAHLHMGNYAADLSLKGGDEFTAFVRHLAELGRNSARHLGTTHAWLGGIKNCELLLRWRDFSHEMADRFVVAEPKKRVKWFGPEMSVLSSISARLMETWAHGQALYDIFGKPRIDTDRIKSVAVIGLNTLGWTFANRGIKPLGVRPNVRLTAPSGALWEWPQADCDNLIEGHRRRVLPRRRADPEHRRHLVTGYRKNRQGLDGDRGVFRRPAGKPAAARHPFPPDLNCSETARTTPHESIAKVRLKCLKISRFSIVSRQRVARFALPNTSAGFDETATDPIVESCLPM